MERRERPLLPDQRPGMRARSQLPRHGVDDNSPGEAEVEMYVGNRLSSQPHPPQAHPGNCICIEFDPTGKYFAVGSADALVSLWDAAELACVRTFARLEWPVRAISFRDHSHIISINYESDFCIPL